jgi:AAA family ATP:ADP antiporter
MINGLRRFIKWTKMQLTNTERMLQVFTEVKAGEGYTALLMFANVFLILCAYYFIKPLREGWVAVSDISGLSKMEVRAYSSFAQSLLLLLIVGWYGRLATYYSRVSLITRVTLFCIITLVIFWFLQPGLFIENLPISGIIFYLWVGMFGVFVVAQFWTFCADIYTDESGKRLLPLIAIGGTTGATAGSGMVDLFVNSGIVPTEALLLIATLPLFISIKLTRIVDVRHRNKVLSGIHKSSAGTGVPLTDKKHIGSVFSGAKLIFISRFLLLAALVTLLTNWVNTNGENLLFRVVQETLANLAAEQEITDTQKILEFIRDGTTAFYGDFYFWVNIIALFLQSFVASRLLKLGGFGVILMMLPVIAFVSYTAMALLPILVIVKIMKIAENATDYSINNTARHVLWLPVDSMTKFIGKPAIDTLYVRVGDGLAAITVMIGVHWLSLSTAYFFIFNVSLVVLWLICGILLVREYNKALAKNESNSVD